MTEINAAVYRGLAEELGDLELQIDAIQDAKKAAYARIRKDFGKVVAEGMKGVIRLLRMDQSKREEKLIIDAQARKIFEILGRDFNAVTGATEEHGVLHQQDANEGWRGDRDQERNQPFSEAGSLTGDTPPHDPEIGEILDEPERERETPIASNDDNRPLSEAAVLPTSRYLDDDVVKDLDFSSAA